LHGGGNFEKESHTMDRKFEVGKWEKKRKRKEKERRYQMGERIRLHNE
jgi:hypothetical protein